MSPNESSAVLRYETAPKTQIYAKGDFSSMITDAVSYLRPAAMRVRNAPIDKLGFHQGYFALQHAAQACSSLFRVAASHPRNIDDHMRIAAESFRELGREMLVLHPQGEDQKKYLVLVDIAAQMKNQVLDLEATIQNPNPVLVCRHPKAGEPAEQGCYSLNFSGKPYGVTGAISFNVNNPQLQETYRTLYEVAENLFAMAAKAPENRRSKRENSTKEFEAKELRRTG